MDFKILSFELKSASGDGSTFSGYANCFHNIDSAQEIVAPGAFADTLAEFMASGFIGGLNHNWDSPIGRPVSASEDARGLLVEGKISPTEHGKDCMVLLKDGVIKKMSIGYRVQGDAMLTDADEVAAYWKEAGYTPSVKDVAASQRGARLLTKLHLYEFSPVTVPANTMADITRVKRYSDEDLTTERDWERFLRDAGLSRKQATAFVSVGFKGLQRDADEAKPPEPPDVPDTAEEPAQPTPEPPIEAVSFVVDEVPKVDQSEIRALYASLLTRRAGLLATR